MIRPVVFVVVGAGAFGALLGCWIALSASPVVTTVLPLLFAFAGGAGGAALWRLDPKLPINLRTLEVFGAGAGAFSLLCLGAMLLTLYLRTTIAGWLVPKPDIVSVTLYADPLGSLIYRDELTALGATNDEIRILLGRPFPDGWKTSAELLNKVALETRAATVSELNPGSNLRNVLTSETMTLPGNIFLAPPGPDRRTKPSDGK